MLEKVSIEEIFRILKRRFFIIILTTICMTSLIVISSIYWMKPVYQHSTQVLAGSLGTEARETTVNDVQENRQLVLSYMDIIKSPSIMGTVKEELSLTRSSYKLREQISVTNRDNSQIITISVKDSNPKLTKDIAQAVAEQSIAKFKVYTNVSKLSIIDDSMILEETELLFPKLKFIIAIATVVSFFIGISLAFIREYNDDRVYGEEELEYCDLLILGRAQLNTQKKSKKKKIAYQTIPLKERGEHIGS